MLSLQEIQLLTAKIFAAKSLKVAIKSISGDIFVATTLPQKVAITKSFSRSFIKSRLKVRNYQAATKNVIFSNDNY